MSKVKKNKLIKELEETLIKKGVDIDEISDVLKKIENNLKDKKYGLVWEEHTEEIEKELMIKFPVLKEEEGLRINKGEEHTNNFLIEGDNLESLTALKNMGKKVDVIEIDPPYGTGNKDFIYEDSFVDSEDSFRHSKWLSFMEKRLTLAKELLTDDGAVFIHIDDNEKSNLKLLCDSVFGESNFISDIVWENKEGGGKSDSKFLRVKHESIMVYLKNKQGFLESYPEGFKSLDVTNIERYKESDEYEERRGPYQLQRLNASGIRYSESLDYPIEAPGGEILYANEEGKKEKTWRWSKDKLKWGIEKGFVVFKKVKGVQYVYTKQYLRVDNKDKEIVRGHKPLGVINDFSTIQSSRRLRGMFNGSKVFDYSKPVELIQYLLKLIPNKNITVMDFFAGSGTTGDAVLELNKEDGGNRSFILATNNENNICREVTYERINKVINGYTTPKGKEVEGIPSNLTYLKTELKDKEDNLGEFGLDENLLEHAINNLKLIHNLSQETELIENVLYELEDSKKNTKYIIYNNFFIDEEDLKKVNKSENNVIYVSEENLLDSNLLEFDEVRNLNDLIVYK